MVNLLPEDFRRQEEREHNETLADKQHENVVMYTQAKMMKKEQAHKGELPVETPRGGVSGNESNKTLQRSVSPTAPLPSFVKKGGIKKESFFHLFKKNILSMFGKKHDRTLTVHAQLKAHTQVLQEIDLGKKVKNTQEEKIREKKKSSSPRMEVNLISEDVLMERSEHVAFAKLGMIALASVCSVGIVWFLLQIAVTQKQIRIDQLSSAKDSIEKEVSRITAQTTAARKIQNRISAAQALADEHLSWLKLLSFFEENTLASVSFDGIALDKNDPYTYALQTRAPRVEDMLAQWRVFEDSEFVESATISGYSRDDETAIASVSETGLSEDGQSQEGALQSSHKPGISFTIEIMLKPSVFD